MDDNKQFDFNELLETTQKIHEDENPHDEEADLGQSEESNRSGLPSDAEIASLVSAALGRAKGDASAAVIAVMNALVKQFGLTQEQIREIIPKIGLASDIHTSLHKTGISPEDTRSPERKAIDAERLGKKRPEMK